MIFWKEFRLSETLERALEDVSPEDFGFLSKPFRDIGMMVERSPEGKTVATPGSYNSPHGGTVMRVAILFLNWSSSVGDCFGGCIKDQLCIGKAIWFPDFSAGPRKVPYASFVCEVLDSESIADEKRRSYVQDPNVQFYLEIDIKEYVPADSTSLTSLTAKVYEEDAEEPTRNVEFAPPHCTGPGTHVLVFSYERLFHEVDTPENAVDFELDLYAIQREVVLAINGMPSISRSS